MPAVSICKVLIFNLLQYHFCIMFCGFFFGREACRILAPQPGMEPALSALEGEVLTTGPPENSPKGPLL